MNKIIIFTAIIIISLFVVFVFVRPNKNMGKKDLMREPLEIAVALPSVEKEDDDFKAEAQEMLEDLD